MTLTTAQSVPDAGGEIELEPTYDGPLERPSHAAHVALVAGSMASIGTETDSLRRHRLGAAALCIAIVYAILFVWNVVTREGVHFAIPLLFSARLIISAAVAWLILSNRPLTPRQVRGIEYGLFATMTLLLCISQYVVNFEYIRQGNAAGVIAFEKNGVIQLFALMILYGLLLPNDARSTARVVLTMALAPSLTLALVLERPEAAAIIQTMRSAEQIGTNILCILIGAGLSIYGAHVLNGLRTELHEARRFGQYQLRRKIGSGGMGDVYLAEHQLLKRPCALKLIQGSSPDMAIALARFEREVQSAARLSHPNVIEIYDYGHTDDGTFYYVMEFLPGMSLAELVPQAGPLPPGRAIYLMRQVCAGLAEAHALGIIHRDLKPANIFVAIRGGEYDVVKVLDFGLVKLTREPGAVELTSDQVVSGTPTFMSPEQAIGEHEIDGRADIYALGAVLYYVLTGRPPFTGTSPTALMIAHARDPVIPPSTIRADIPADLEQVVLRCLTKTPAERFADVRAFGKALAECEAAKDWDQDRAEAWWIAQAQSAMETAEASDSEPQQPPVSALATA